MRYFSGANMRAETGRAETAQLGEKTAWANRDCKTQRNIWLPDLDSNQRAAD